MALPVTVACWCQRPCTLPGPASLPHEPPDTNRLVWAHWTRLPAPELWGNQRQRRENLLKSEITTTKHNWIKLSPCPNGLLNQTRRNVHQQNRLLFKSRVSDGDCETSCRYSWGCVGWWDRCKIFPQKSDKCGSFVIKVGWEQSRVRTSKEKIFNTPLPLFICFKIRRLRKIFA